MSSQQFNEDLFPQETLYVKNDFAIQVKSDRRSYRPNPRIAIGTETENYYDDGYIRLSAGEILIETEYETIDLVRKLRDINNIKQIRNLLDETRDELDKIKEEITEARDELNQTRREVQANRDQIQVLIDMNRMREIDSNKGKYINDIKNEN